MKVRQLTAGDLFKVGKMLRTVLPDLQKINTSYTPGENQKEKNARIGQEFINLLLDKCFDDAWAWLASMVDMSVDEFNKLPMSAVLDVISAIKEDESAADFFTRLAGLTKGSPLTQSLNVMAGQ